jgi:hypothetical protein
MTQHLEALYGFATAGVSALALWIAQVAPSIASPALETGGTIGLIGGLSFALIIVWRDRAELVKSLHEAEAARLADSKEANKQYREDSEKGEASRQELIRELRTQTVAIKENKR